MRRIVIPTLEKADGRGGIGRYIDAIVSTYPDAKVVRLEDAKYPTIYRAISPYNRDFVQFVHEVIPVGTVAWLLRKSYIIFLHGKDFDLARRNVWKRWLTKRILRGAEAVVVNSEGLKKEVDAFVGAERVQPILCVYPPVSDEMVEASKGTRKGKGWTDLRDLAKLAAGAIGLSITAPQPPPSKGGGATLTTLITVARLVERKGHLKVLDAMVKLPNTKYVIVGDGPMREKIEMRVAELGLSERVTIMTDIADEDLPTLYADADIFVMPTTQSKTDREGFGIVYLEANLFGLPVVGTRTGGVAEAILDGKTGVLVEDATDDLVRGLQVLIDSPELRSAMGSRGRVRVLEQFTREEQMGKLKEIIEASYDKRT
ncbi:MAG: glycosyltransferase family 4 protein [Patescibacteria group bacterium]|jgi:glycosyltransferase involved in cell wall biosynthesis